MATLTTLEKTKVRMYLGYADIFRYKNTRLEGVLEAGTISDDVVAIIQATIVKLDALDATLTGSDGIAVGSAGVKSVDEIVFKDDGNGSNSTIGDLQRIGRMLVARISTALGVTIYADFFDGEGWPGDRYSALGGMGRNGGRGGIMNIG